VANVNYFDEGQNPSRLGYQADLHYEGSISIDRSRLGAARFLINERVEIHNIEAGAHSARC
jgi:aspartate 1-decarboxylase